MIDFLFKSSLFMLLLYLLYAVWLKSTEHYVYNRVILLASLAISMCCYLTPVFYENEGVQYLSTRIYDMASVNLSVPSGQEQDSVASFSWVMIIYWGGACLIGLRLLVGLVQILHKCLHSTGFDRDGFRWIITDQSMSPTSFFSFLLINRNDLKHPALNTIIIHETCHRKKLHSLDLLLAEIVTVFFWFHPCAWMIRKELRECHEFEADRGVLNSGQDLVAYQHLLFEMRTGHSLIQGHPIAGNISLLKRFKMMNTQKTSLQLKKVVPAAATLLLVIILSSFIGKVQQPDVLPRYLDGDDAMYKTLSKNLRYPFEDRANHHSGTVYVSAVIDTEGRMQEISTGKQSDHLFKEMVVVGYVDGTIANSSGVNQSLENEVIRALRTLGTFEPATRDGKPVPCKVVFPVTFKLEGV